MDVRRYGLLVEAARHRRTVDYSETGRAREHIGSLLDDINRQEKAAGRPMLTVVVVQKGTTDPGPGFLQCAKDLGRFHDGDDPKAFVEAERSWVYRLWAD